MKHSDLSQIEAIDLATFESPGSSDYELVYADQTHDLVELEPYLQLRVLTTPEVSHIYPS